MSDAVPSGSNPFEFLLGDMMKAMSGQGQDPMAMVTQFVQVANADETSAANVEPSLRIRVEELFRLAQLHVDTLRYLPPSSAPTSQSLIVTNPLAFSNLMLTAWRPYIELLLQSMAPQGVISSSLDLQSSDATANPLMAMLGQFGATLTPMLSGAQIGSLIGHFAKEAHAAYDLLMPSTDPSSIVLVPQTIERFAQDWQLDRDSLFIWTLTQQLVTASLLTNDTLRDRLDTEIRLHLVDMRADVTAAMNQLSTLNFTDPEAIQGFLGDPSALVSGEFTEAQRINYEEIEATVAVLSGISNLACRQIGSTVLGATGAIEEALRRRSIEGTEAHRLLAHLFGIEISERAIDLSSSFTEFLADAEHTDALSAIYRDSESFPTIFDLEHPDLWLARVMR
jgi:putative hydrolase